jgi:hypothetical protein
VQVHVHLGLDDLHLVHGQSVTDVALPLACPLQGRCLVGRRERTPPEIAIGRAHLIGDQHGPDSMRCLDPSRVALDWATIPEGLVLADGQVLLHQVDGVPEGEGLVASAVVTLPDGSMLQQIGRTRRW